jgi:L-iditol 2-dehydrogenase
MEADYALMQSTKAGGKVVIVGMGTPNHTLPISDASAREIDLIPTWRYANCYPSAITMMKRAAIDEALPNLRTMITHVFRGLESVPQAFEMASKSRDMDGKLVIKTVITN